MKIISWNVNDFWMRFLEYVESVFSWKMSTWSAEDTTRPFTLLTKDTSLLTLKNI